jgi:hypothetical protein
VLADDAAAMRRDFEEPMARVLGSHDYAKVLEDEVERVQDSSCAYLALDRDYVYSGAVIFSRSAPSDPNFLNCVAPALAGVFGLQGRLREPGSIKSDYVHLRRLTDLDRDALRILYDPAVRPGQKLREIPALDDDI